MPLALPPQNQIRGLDNTHGFWSKSFASNPVALGMTESLSTVELTCKYFSDHMVYIIFYM